MSARVVMQNTQPSETTGSARGAIVTGAIVHVGAGYCRELAGYLSEPAGRIILVEADPDQARELRQRVTDNNRVEVIAVAVAPIAGVVRLKRFRLGTLNSLRAPTGIHELYPGLRLQDEIDVEAITPRQLIEMLELRLGQSNRLIIDTPGEEAAIVHALQEGGDLAVFERIDLCCGTSNHYEGNQDATAVLRILGQHGYEVEGCDDRTDPDRPCWFLRRNLVKLQNRVLRDQLTEVKAARDTLAHQLSEKIVELEWLQGTEGQLRTHVAEQERQFADLQRDRDMQAAHSEQLRSRIDDLSAERDDAIKQLSLLQRQYESEMSQVREESAAFRTRLADSVEVCDEFKRQISAYRSEIDRLEAAEGDLRELIAEQEQKIAELVGVYDELLQRAAEQEVHIRKLVEERDAGIEFKSRSMRELEKCRSEIARFEMTESELHTKIGDRDARIVRLSEERDGALAAAESLNRQLDVLRTHAMTESQGLQAQLTEALSVSDEMNDQFADVRSDIEGLRSVIQVMKELVEQRDLHISDLRRACDESSNSVAEKEKDLQILRKDLSVALRFRSLREADLKDLQRSYAALLQEKLQRDDLLGVLAQRLEIAEQYLQQVTDQDRADSVGGLLEDYGSSEPHTECRKP